MHCQTQFKVCLHLLFWKTPIFDLNLTKCFSDSSTSHQITSIDGITSTNCLQRMIAQPSTVWQVNGFQKWQVSIHLVKIRPLIRYVYHIWVGNTKYSYGIRKFVYCNPEKMKKKNIEKLICSWKKRPQICICTYLSAFI